MPYISFHSFLHYQRLPIWPELGTGNGNGNGNGRRLFFAGLMFVMGPRFIRHYGDWEGVIGDFCLLPERDIGVSAIEEWWLGEMSAEGFAGGGFCI